MTSTIHYTIQMMTTIEDEFALKKMDLMVLKVSNISGTQESSASSSLADANSLDHLHSSAT